MSKSPSPQTSSEKPASSEVASVKGTGQLGELALLWQYTRRYPRQLAVAAVALIVASLATLGIPMGFLRVVDQGFLAQGGSIDRGFGFLFAVVLVLGLATATRFYCVSWLGERVVADIRVGVLANLSGLAPSFFEDNRPAEIASRITADTTLIDQAVGTSISVALRNFFTGIGGVVYLFVLAPKLALILLAGIPAIVVPIVLIGRKVRSFSRDSQDRIAQVGTLAVEMLSAIKIVQAFGQERREVARFADATEASFAAARRRIGVRAIMTAIVIVLLFGGITAILWEGAHDVQAGRMTGGTITAFVLTGGIVTGAFGALTEVYGDLLRSAGAASRLAELLRVAPQITAPAHPVALPEPPRGEIAFAGVTFHYPTRPEVAALANLSLTVRTGERVALVGPSGAGKSTLFQLLQRFYDPEQGEVRIDGVAISTADPAQVRARIAMVPQETVIFAASARDNLRYGCWDANDDRIWAAAEAANASDFLRALPQGLDTYLGDGGARLSGGQRQRVAIARALLREAPILLLDEATSALDAESENLVQQALERLMAGRTSIVIAHRLATVRASDRIIVMDGGRIVEEGRHEALVQAQGGLYARLARLQFDGELKA